MSAKLDLATIGALLGEESRATMLGNLLDGRALTARELALAAGVTPQTASFHLSKLRDGGLLTMLRQGRHNYYRIAGDDIAAAIRGLQLIAPGTTPSKPKKVNGERLARSCYSHLAGRLGVAVTEAMQEKDLLRARDKDFELTLFGEAFCADLGIATAPLRRGRGHFARQCLDWSERKPHLGGALGAALFDQFLERGWLQRQPGNRAVQLTRAGSRQLRERLGVTDWDR